MAEKLKIISLGGLNEIGKNMTVLEYGDDILLIDCGLSFPDDDMYGVDIVIPDITYLIRNKNRIRAIAITHGHEDHIGSIPYVVREVDAPIYATRLTVGLMELKLQEHGLLKKAHIVPLEAGDTFTAGCFKVEFIHTNHSIADSVALAITTPLGLVIHTGDFKIDTTPIEGGMIDIARFAELGKQGVLALMSDSTNVEKPGYSVSESRVGDNLEAFFDYDGRIIVTTFASNVHRIQQVINCAHKYGRKVGITGRSMENTLRVAQELGYLNVPDNTMVDMNRIRNIPRDKIVIITTGSQGETMSALYRMAFSDHKQIEISAGDRVIISASAIPGNEKMVGRVINELFRRGAEVIYDRNIGLHASGHACKEELRMMIALTKPKFFIPVHGEQRHLKLHADLAKQMGIPQNNIIVSSIGTVIELSKKHIRTNGVVPAGQILVDGSGVGDVGSVVLRDRKHLAQDGMVVAVVGISSEDGSITSGPDIITRGFVYVKESEELINDLKHKVADAVYDCQWRNITDWAAIKGVIKGSLSEYLYKHTRRTPMILPVVMET